MEYTISKKKIKNFIIRIYPDCSIKISVPINATKEQINNFIKTKEDWIDKTIKKLENRKEKVEENRIKILGKKRKIHLIKSEYNLVRLSENSVYIYHMEDDVSEEKLRNILEGWQLEKLESLLKKYLNKYLAILSTEIKGYKIKKMISAWGIYHARENYITFNFLLIEKEEECIEYVVLHELCHIFYLNHQKEFWSLLEKYMKNYKEIRKKLRD